MLKPFALNNVINLKCSTFGEINEPGYAVKVFIGGAELDLIQLQKLLAWVGRAITIHQTLPNKFEKESSRQEFLKVSAPYDYKIRLNKNDGANGSGQLDFDFNKSDNVG